MRWDIRVCLDITAWTMLYAGLNAPGVPAMIGAISFFAALSAIAIVVPDSGD